MPWRPMISLLHININSLDIQGNPLLSIAGNGANFISQSNNQHSQIHPTLQEPQNGACYQSSGAPTLRRVEAQMRIRRKLDEACGHPGSVYGIDNVAQVATSILSIVEGATASAFSSSLMDLAMNAHAMAYITLISFLYRFDENGKRRIRKKNVQDLRGALNSVHTLLVEELSQKGIYMRIKWILNKSRRGDQVLRRLQDKLLGILREIERDESANILNSLTAALDCPYQ